MSLCVHHVADEREWERLEPEWNALLARSNANTPFLTWEWVTTWWSIYGQRGRLCVVTCHDVAGTLIGLAPLQRRRRWLLGVWPVDLVEFIGHGGDVTPEYLDLIAVDGYHEAVAEAVARHITGLADVDGVDLRPLRSDSLHLEPLRRVLESAGLSVSVAVNSVCPVMTLPESDAAFVAARSRNYRKKLGEFRRRCGREIGGRVRVSATVDELREDMSKLVDLHQKRWRGQSQAFRTPEYVTFHHSLSQRFLVKGWVRLFCLDTSQGPAGLLYCFVYGGRYYYYQSGRDPTHERHRVGLLLLDHAIRVAIGEGAREFDFLTGQEPYRYRWADTEWRSVALVGWRTGIPAVIGGLRAALRRAKQRASELWGRGLRLQRVDAGDNGRRNAHPPAPTRGQRDEHETQA